MKVSRRSRGGNGDKEGRLKAARPSCEEMLEVGRWERGEAGSGEFTGRAGGRGKEHAVTMCKGEGVSNLRVQGSGLNDELHNERRVCK